MSSSLTGIKRHGTVLTLPSLPVSSFSFPPLPLFFLHNLLPTISYPSIPHALVISSSLPPFFSSEESLLCLTVGVPLLTFISIVTLVSTPIIVLVILHLRRTMQQRKTWQQKTMQLRSQTSYIQMSVLCEEITSSTASGLPLLSSRGVTRKAEVGSMIYVNLT